MVTVRMLKPYYIKADENYIRVILAYQYFSVFINKEVYQFIPIEAKEIRLHRKNQKIVNTEARFAFQKGKDIIYIAMTELISLPDFLSELYSIVEQYYAQNIVEDEHEDEPNIESDLVVKELEKLNLNRLIDRALDERDAQAFYSLTKLL